MEEFPYVICDVFTDLPLAGNQLAVFPHGQDVPDKLLQPLAREVNFSETVFVYPPQRGGDAQIRIFTPVSEMRFAGHPVLGTAVTLGIGRNLDGVRLETRAGIVPVSLKREGLRAAFGWMDQPLPAIRTFPLEHDLFVAIGCEGSLLPVELYDNGMPHVFVALDRSETVAGLQPDFQALTRLTRNAGVPALGVNCFAGDGRHWKTRMFAPADGVPEDPATGSAAGPLACHLARHGRIRFGDEIEISQGAEIGRPSTLYARAEGTMERIERVVVGGRAIIVADGKFAIPSANSG